MKSVINLYKPVGITPLQAVEKFKEKNPVYVRKKISYPGRLDPMAQGILLLLVENENKKMIKYMKLDKKYRAQILFNFTTDTYDILGLPEFYKRIINEKELKKAVKSFQGIYTQTLPPYSSYKIKGKALFNYARSGKLDEIKLPKKKVKIKEIKINSIHTITANRLLKQIQSKISKLKGDFRQEQILKQWNKLLTNKEQKFLVIDITFQVSSGTYIRAITHNLGQKLNTGAILLNLIRTKVGKYDVKDSVRLK